MAVGVAHTTDGGTAAACQPGGRHRGHRTAPKGRGAGRDSPTADGGAALAHAAVGERDPQASTLDGLHRVGLHRQVGRDSGGREAGVMEGGGMSGGGWEERRMDVKTRAGGWATGHRQGKMVGHPTAEV